MPPKAKTAARKPAKGKKPVFAPPLQEGEILRDIQKKEWRVGKVVGSGGFGQLYLASQNTVKPVSQDAEYVVKIEPHESGPLFCELNFYQRVAKPDMVESWKKEKKIKKLGMPVFIAQGCHEVGGVKCRFMIMQRFGQDLQKLFVSLNRSFPHKCVLMLALRLIDVLEYIHSKGYVHADIKASNLLLGHASNVKDQVFLVDYGLAYRFITDSGPKEYKEDPRKAHDGTIEFTSRDAHKGVSPSYRGDLEILGYCLLQWLCGQLPWEDNLEKKDYVRDQKIKYMANIPLLLKTCFPDGNVKEGIPEYLQYVNKLDYSQIPDYDHVRKIFSTALKNHGFKDDGHLVFSKGATKGITEAEPSPANGRKVTAKSKAKKMDEHASTPVTPTRGNKVKSRKRKSDITEDESPLGKKKKQEPTRKTKFVLHEQMNVSNNNVDSSSEEEEYYSPRGRIRKSPAVLSPRSKVTAVRKENVKSPKTPSQNLRVIKQKRKRGKKLGITTATQTTPTLKANR